MKRALTIAKFHHAEDDVSRCKNRFHELIRASLDYRLWIIP